MIDKALEYFHESLRQKQECGVGKDDLASCYFNIGACYSGLHHLDLAQSSYAFARKIWEESGDRVKLAYLYNNIGAVCVRMEELEKARENYQKALGTPQQSIPHPRSRIAEKLIAGLVFKILIKEGMIAEELVENMRSWKHSGFSVHCGKPIKDCDADGRKTLTGIHINGSLFIGKDELFIDQQLLDIALYGAHYYVQFGGHYENGFIH